MCVQEFTILDMPKLSGYLVFLHYSTVVILLLLRYSIFCYQAGRGGGSGPRTRKMQQDGRPDGRPDGCPDGRLEALCCKLGVGGDPELQLKSQQSVKTKRLSLT